MICLTSKPLYTKKKERNFFTEKELFKKKEEWRIEQQKESILTTFATAIKKDPITSIRKPANELKVYEKKL